eukprot:TRINITY_DN11964_c0_g1_i3.p1 TRINITY_DN11964_c0_g1~~TRINITY_DN11964_c0_g1_i3.p1  ORF type:complete len:343 (-),score=-12.81 TRINITY_DN11964_c0_g1_i3:25-1032(-)
MLAVLRPPLGYTSFYIAIPMWRMSSITHIRKKSTSNGAPKTFSNYHTKKDIMRLQEGRRLQWHKSVDSQAPARSLPSLDLRPHLDVSSVSRRQQFLQTPIDPTILSIITNYALGRRRTRHMSNVQHNARSLQYIPMKMKLTKSAESPESFLPESDSRVEVAFVGRSNSGKSSIINALCAGGKAKVSERPGETRTVDWFDLGRTLCLVDLPGYGFAYASPEHTQQWQSMMENYLSTRRNLRRVYVLVDSRLGLTLRDTEMLRNISSWRKTFQIILTKCDLVEPIDLARRCYHVREAVRGLRGFIKPVLMASALDKSGLQRIRDEMLALVPNKAIET